METAWRGVKVKISMSVSYSSYALYRSTGRVVSIAWTRTI